MGKHVCQQRLNCWNIYWYTTDALFDDSNWSDCPLVIQLFMVKLLFNWKVAPCRLIPSEHVKTLKMEYTHNAIRRCLLIQAQGSRHFPHHREFLKFPQRILLIWSDSTKSQSPEQCIWADVSIDLGLYILSIYHQIGFSIVMKPGKCNTHSTVP